MSIKGQDVFRRALASLPFTIDQELIDVVDEAVVSEFRRQSQDIPFYEGKPYTDKYGKHGGPLRNSLTSTTDPYHFAGVVGDTIEIGTEVEYAKYNTLPEPDARTIEAAILRLFMERLRREGGT